MQKELNHYLVIDWQNGSTRTRKSKPSQTEIGTHEIVTDLDLEIVIPEVEVPSIEAEIEVPQPRVEGAEAASLDADEQEDWRDYADEVVEEAFDRYDDLNWDDHGHRLTLEVIEDVPGYPDPADVRNYVSDVMYAKGFEHRDEEVVA